MPRRPEARLGPTAAQRVAGQLRDRILDGALPPGSPLREEELAARLDVSRHTLRAAFAELRAERLLVAVPYAGMRVASLDDAELVALQQLRGALEAEAVRLIAAEHHERWPTAVRGPVLDAIRRLESAEAEGDWRATTRAHAAVHRRLVEAAGSARITEAHAALESEILLLLAHVRPDYPPGALAAEHRAYLDDLPSEGGAAVHAHLAHSTALIRAARAAGGREPR